MLDSLVEALDQSGQAWTRQGRIRSRLAAVFALVAVLLAAAYLVPVHSVQVFLGSLAGLGLFCCGYLAWAHLLAEGRRKALDWRGRWPLNKRRMAAVWCVIGWGAVVLSVSKVIPGGPLIGALTVAVLLSVWRMASATRQEIELLNAVIAEDLAAREEQAESTDRLGRLARLLRRPPRSS